MGPRGMSPAFSKSFPDGRTAEVWLLIFETARITVTRDFQSLDDQW